MKIVLLLLAVWVPSTLCVSSSFKPEIPSATFFRGLRTSTTVTLAKPVCVFQSGVVEVFGVQSTASTNDIGTSPQSYQQTRGGELRPYRAGRFEILQCTSPLLRITADPKLVQKEINGYLFRVGNDVQCLNKIDTESGDCNAPLNGSASYRFKFAVRNSATGAIENETLWSEPISLIQVSDYRVINTEIGYRTGGMVVITTILVILLFLILCAFVISLVISYMKEEHPVMEQQPIPKTYITHQRNEGYAETLPTAGPRLAAQQPTEPSLYQVIEKSA
ncbi:uroplakin-3a-like [Hypanus sabinus]|uniref:uroplakin-3a-like n=1 Tax=Hypanus sabinus TaxID=79690 RepID=UPI0028C49B38|nr:uroplakin-3a-like [Hypanus sabinus]